MRRGLLQTFRSRLRKGEERATEKVLSCGRKPLFLPFLSQFYPPTFLRPPPNPLSPPFAAAVVSGMHNQGWPKRRRRRRRGQFHSLPKSCIHGSPSSSSDPPSPSSRLPSPPCGFLTLPSLPWVKRPEKGGKEGGGGRRTDFSSSASVGKRKSVVSLFPVLLVLAGRLSRRTNERTSSSASVVAGGRETGDLFHLQGESPLSALGSLGCPRRGASLGGTQKGLYCSRVEATETTEGILPSSLEVSF